MIPHRRNLNKGFYFPQNMLKACINRPHLISPSPLLQCVHMGTCVQIHEMPSMRRNKQRICYQSIILIKKIVSLCTSLTYRNPSCFNFDILLIHLKNVIFLYSYYVFFSERFPALLKSAINRNLT